MSDAHSISVRTYTLVFIALMVLLGVTVAAGYVDLGHNYNLILAMAIATVKAALIVLFFMHVKVSTRWVWLFFGLSLYMLLAGAILTFADYLMRQ